MADDLGEKTEAATPKRLSDAREEGNVPKSMDFAGAFMLLLLTFMLWWMTTSMLGMGKVMVAQALDGSTMGNPIDPGSIWTLVKFLSASAVKIILPLLLMAWFFAGLSQVSQVGVMFSPKSITPSLNKLNPIKGFKKLVGISAVFKASMDFMKVMIVLVVAMVTVYQKIDHILVLPYLTAFQGLVTIGHLMFDVALRLLAILLLLGLLDLIYQRWKFSEDMKMTKQQIKDEMKQSDGDPEVKRRRLRMQQQIAYQRVSTAVPKADVIVTNPEHISIAIQYDQDVSDAPRVVAKGADFLAMRIRQIAIKHNIPIVERKPLARALYKDVAVGQEVPPEFFQAVAEILAYVYRLSGRKAS